MEQNLRTHISDTVKMCKQLIDSGADVNIRMYTTSQTVYHFIVQIVLRLLAEDIDDEQQQQLTSLANELVKFFTNNQHVNITLNSRDEEGNTPLHTVSKAVQAILYINSTCTISHIKFKQRQNYSMLTIPLLDCLISCGNNVSATNDKQQTSLHLASSVPVIQALLRLGAKPNVRDQNENTPLMLWALALNEIPPTDIKALFPVLKHLKSSLSSPMETEWLFSSSTDLRKFFEQGVDPFVANLNGDTILNVFLSREKFRYAKNFIEAVLAVNPLNAGRLDNSGDALLHVLCKCDDDRVQELIELVLNLGADPNFSNQAKDKPLHIL